MKVELTRQLLSEQNLANLLEHDKALIAQHVNCIHLSSATWIGWADGVEAAAIGTIPMGTFSDDPYLWLIYTKICQQHPLRFMRWGRRAMDEVLTLYPRVVGLCRCDNADGRRWLEWLGAVFDDHVYRGYGVYGDHFGFRMTRHG